MVIKCDVLKYMKGIFFFEIYKCYMYVNVGCFKEV